MTASSIQSFCYLKSEIEYYNDKGHNTYIGNGLILMYVYKNFYLGNLNTNSSDY